MTITRINDYINGTTADGDQIRAEFNNVIAGLNIHAATATLDHPTGSVTTAKIADANVTTSKILDANVTEPKIGPQAVTNRKLVRGRDYATGVEASGSGVLSTALNGDPTDANGSVCAIDNTPTANYTGWIMVFTSGLNIGKRAVIASRSVANKTVTLETAVNGGGNATKTIKTPVTMTSANPGVVTYAAHGFTEGKPIMFKTTGALPTNLKAAGTIYYVRNPVTDTFNVSDTATGALIDTTDGTQSGVHSIWHDGSLDNDTCIIIPGTIQGVHIGDKEIIEAHLAPALSAKLFPAKIKVPHTEFWGSDPELRSNDDYLHAYGDNANAQAGVNIPDGYKAVAVTVYGSDSTNKYIVYECVYNDAGKTNLMGGTTDTAFNTEATLATPLTASGYNYMVIVAGIGKNDNLYGAVVTLEAI